MRAALRVARAHGIDADPLVLHEGVNVLVHLRPAPVVARVATLTAAVRAGGAERWLAREVAVATHAAARGAPVAAPSTLLPPGPHVEDGLALTFWALVPHDPDRAPGDRELGASLRRVHEALAGHDGELPASGGLLDEAHAILADVAVDGALTQDDAGVLARAWQRLASLGEAGPAQALHGDAYLRNVLATAAGPVWIDLEDTCRGPREWDLACLLTPRAVRGAGPERDAVLAGYGLAVDADAMERLMEARAYQVVAWTLLAERARRSEPGRAQPWIRWLAARAEAATA